MDDIVSMDFEDYIKLRKIYLDQEKENKKNNKTDEKIDQNKKSIEIQEPEKDNEIKEVDLKLTVSEELLGILYVSTQSKIFKIFMRIAKIIVEYGFLMTLMYVLFINLQNLMNLFIEFYNLILAFF